MSSEHEIDARLVARVQQGDKKAFDLLVLKYQRRVMRLISRMVRRQYEVEDIAQEVFITAYRGLPKFQGNSAFYTWLYRITINCTHSYLEKHHKHSVLADAKKLPDGETFYHSDSLSDHDTPETHLVNQEIVQTVNQAIDALSEELRRVIVLREIEGMSYDEIAQFMCIPVGTVRSRIFRAREAIAARLKPVLLHNGDQRW